MAFNRMDALEVAKSAAIKRESSRLIKKKALDYLYKDMYNLINEEIHRIKDKITQQMVFNKDNKKSRRDHKIIFYSANTYDMDDYVQLFEHCYDDVLDDPLIDQLRRKFPDYKVYRKIIAEYDKYENKTYYYVIYIKWGKKNGL